MWNLIESEVSCDYRALDVYGEYKAVQGRVDNSGNCVAVHGSVKRVFGREKRRN